MARGTIYECINGKVDQVFSDTVENGVNLLDAYLKILQEGVRNNPAEEGRVEEIKDAITKGINIVMNYKATASGGMLPADSLPVISKYDIGDEVKELKLT